MSSISLLNPENLSLMIRQYLSDSLPGAWDLKKTTTLHSYPNVLERNIEQSKNDSPTCSIAAGMSSEAQIWLRTLSHD